jgi:hypothetical protein
MDTKEVEQLSKICYYVCLGLLAVLGILCIVYKIFDIQISGNLPGRCFLHEMTGYYCPGCGGTRAVDALLRGHWGKSLYYHPVVVYTVVVVILYVLSHTLSILTKGRVRAMLFRPAYLYIMVGIILLQWIVKNAVYFLAGISLI